ncbi:Smyd1 [Symbiodinium pilosum]|uniref:Smyd1 protein n=1 Tax=Symbiodinium pilosum TaxID=2952 RepID=A0A812WWW8_SYMPI|nr:Smyd1 [Symbiodinium pilosum]
MHDPDSERCRRFVNPDRKGGFGLRNLLASATVENASMDKKQVERAQKKLDSEYAGKGVRATLIYEVFKGGKPPQSDGAKELPRSMWEKVQLREPDAELDTLWAPERCSCYCGCRAELGAGEGLSLTVLDPSRILSPLAYQEEPQSQLGKATWMEGISEEEEGFKEKPLNKQLILQNARPNVFGKEFEKLLQCGRCKNAFYCSRENICRKPDEEAPEASLQAWRITQSAKPAPKANPERSGRLIVGEEDVSETESLQQVRQELLKETKEVNAKMVTAMQDARGDPTAFLPEVQRLKEEYQQLLRDRLRSCNSFKAAAEDDLVAASVKMGEELMKEVIMALLQRGMSNSAGVDQLDLANNHFRAGILQQNPTEAFALQDGDLDGFEPAVLRVVDKGFVTVEGLLDAEIAQVISEECETNFWKRRDVGAMSAAQATAEGIFECWVPYPARRCMSPEFQHALRILFGLPHEFARNKYGMKLKVPTMAHLACIPPGAKEAVHLDFAGGSASGRELTFSLFLTHQWTAEDGGAFRAYVDGDDKVLTHPPGSAEELPRASCREQGSAEEGGAVFKDVFPEVGRCLIFQSKRLWHEIRPPSKMLWVLSLFAYTE